MFKKRCCHGGLLTTAHPNLLCNRNSPRYLHSPLLLFSSDTISTKDGNNNDDDLGDDDGNDENDDPDGSDNDDGQAVGTVGPWGQVVSPEPANEQVR